MAREFDQVLICESCQARHFLRDGAVVSVMRYVGPAQDSGEFVPIPVGVPSGTISSAECRQGTFDSSPELDREILTELGCVLVEAT